MAPTPPATAPAPVTTHAPDTPVRPYTPPTPSTPPVNIPGNVLATVAPATMPGTLSRRYPGRQAAAAVTRDGRITRVTRIAHAVPGKPDGEVDTRPRPRLPTHRRPSRPTARNH